MPTDAEQGFAVDTSVAVAALDANHEFHDVSRSACVRCRPATAGHARLETYSVLTRLPGPSRPSPKVAAEALRRAFPAAAWLRPAQHDSLMARLAELGIVGGMVYDALVGEAARVHSLVLLTRDQRAARVYERLGVSVEFLS